MAYIVIVIGLYVVISGMLGVTLYYTRRATWLRDTALLMITPLAVPLVYGLRVWLGG